MTSKRSLSSAPGGLGKTSVALHLMHHEIVRKRYNDQQFFVGCDGVTTADGLASRVLQILGASTAAGGDVVNSLHAVLKRAPPTLLLLDNFESIWDAHNDHSAVRTLLQIIANVKATSLIITMRATDAPAEIKWSYSETIPVLSPASAKELFIAINGQLPGGSTNDDTILNELLKELDYVPLAIHLLAQVSRGFKPISMLKRWRERRTQMLRLATSKKALDRFESIDISVSLSITSLDVAHNPGAVQLLGMLSLLPDGLLRWQGTTRGHREDVRQRDCGPAALAKIRISLRRRRQAGCSFSHPTLCPPKLSPRLSTRPMHVQHYVGPCS